MHMQSTEVLLLLIKTVTNLPLKKERYYQKYLFGIRKNSHSDYFNLSTFNILILFIILYKSNVIVLYLEYLKCFANWAI